MSNPDPEWVLSTWRYRELCCPIISQVVTSHTTVSLPTHFQQGILTWTWKDARLFKDDLFVCVHGQLQAAAQLLVHHAALTVARAVRHEAGQVPVTRAVSAHHALTRRRGQVSAELLQKTTAAHKYTGLDKNQDNWSTNMFWCYITTGLLLLETTWRNRNREKMLKISLRITLINLFGQTFKTWVEIFQ